MAAATDIFSKNNEKQIAEKIISNIQNGDLHEISHGLCNVRDNSIILDYRYFKHFASKDTYNYIMTNVTTHINNIISSHDKFVVHVNIKSLTVLEVDKHKLFIQFFF